MKGNPRPGSAAGLGCGPLNASAMTVGEQHDREPDGGGLADCRRRLRAASWGNFLPDTDQGADRVIDPPQAALGVPWLYLGALVATVAASTAVSAAVFIANPNGTRRYPPGGVTSELALDSGTKPS